MFAAPPIVETTVFTTIPKALQLDHERSEWNEKRGAPAVHSFLEGPAFDRDGNLFCVDLAFSRIFRISPDGEWDVFARYDGEPNGLKVHKDGRILVADHQLGLLAFDPVTRARSVLSGGPPGGFKGLNDLTIASNGDIYVTDQGETGLDDPTGSIYRLRRTGELDLIFTGLASPNGCVLNLQENLLYVSVTRVNQIVALPIRPDEPGARKARVFIYLSGGLTGPDGITLDSGDNLVVVHAGFGTVWVFNRFGEPIHRIRSCAGIRTTNAAFGVSDPGVLYITEAEHGSILRAKLPVAGRLLFGKP